MSPYYRALRAKNRPWSNLRIRPEEPSDALAVRALNEAAFDSSVEADIVEKLHKKPDDIISLVAESAGEVVGHIVFSPVSLAGDSHSHLMGLGPMAVRPARQRQGIGSALVLEGLNRCRGIGCRAVVVLGHPDYYPRFGFSPASGFGVTSEYDVPDGVFMLIELRAGSLQGASGLATYGKAFAGG